MVLSQQGKQHVGKMALTSSCAWVFAPMESRYSTASFWPASAASCRAVCPSFLTACKKTSSLQLQDKRDPVP